jgi:hypothetical protein
MTRKNPQKDRFLNINLVMLKRGLGISRIRSIFDETAKFKNFKILEEFTYLLLRNFCVGMRK